MTRLLVTLTALVAMVYSPTSLAKFEAAIRAAGNPRDQVERFARHGIFLQPRQLMASAAARPGARPDGPGAVGGGGARGGGKSHWVMAQLADDCLRERELRCLLLRKVGKANRENFEELRRKVLPRVATDYRAGDATLTFTDTGSTVRCGHFQNPSDIDAYLGLEYDVIAIEEATTLDKARVDDIATCNRTSKPDWRPRRYYTTNPGNIGHAWFKAKFIAPMRRGAESATRFIQSTVRDNAAVNRDYVRVLEGLTGWKKRAWLDGDWDIAAGMYFTTWRHPVHVRDDLVARDHWRYWVGLDYGFRHYTAAYLFGENGDGTAYILDEHAERQWLVRSHCEALDAMIARHGLGREQIEATLAGGDVFSKDRDGRAVADEYADHGWYLSRANMNRRDGAAELLRRLGDVDRDPPIEPSLYVSDRCPKLIECIPALCHDEHRAEDVEKVDTDEDGFGGDDFYDAARYGLMHVAGGSRVHLLDADFLN